MTNDCVVGYDVAKTRSMQIVDGRTHTSGDGVHTTL